MAMIKNPGVVSDAKIQAEKVRKAAELSIDEDVEIEHAAERYGVPMTAVIQARSRIRIQRRTTR